MAEGESSPGKASSFWNMPRRKHLKHALNQGKGSEMCLRRVENVRSRNLLLQRFRHSVLLQNHVDRASRSHEDKMPKLINHCCLVNPN